ncbi:GNAT family N-acetyltransferase [Vibrio olivae]|uniref:GNAT family N-acetyltransferase n=1 Tax=Vibrio olivae TaxID=1243002 RepID=A0ABV5HK91_9VIBR
MKKMPPISMKSDRVEIVFEKYIDAKPDEGLVPVYRFKIHNLKGDTVGHINFKLGETVHIKQYAGHIGYEILPQFRGNSYSYFACEAIKPFIQEFFNTIILTCNPDNKPSIKTIKKLNAKFINEVTVPENDPSYKNGSRQKLRYEWQL